MQSPEFPIGQPSNPDIGAVVWQMKILASMSDATNPAAHRKFLEEFKRWADASPANRCSLVETTLTWLALGEFQQERMKEFVGPVLSSLNSRSGENIEDWKMSILNAWMGARPWWNRG